MGNTGSHIPRNSYTGVRSLNLEINMKTTTMKHSSFRCSTAAALLSLGLAAGAQAQTIQSDTPLRENTAGTTLQTDATRHGASLNDNPGAVSKVNKASSLIGMDVRNTQNEKLGEIKDLVVDLQSGKIAYAVLSVGGFLGIGDKYVAVPVNAFSVAVEQDRLTLNADKAKIQNAPGFAKSSWPEVNSPTWSTESTYWLSEPAAQGTSGAIRSGTATETGRGTSPIGADRRLQNDALSTARTDDSSRLGTKVDRDNTTALPSERNTFRGKVTAINPTTRTMTVEGPAGTREFKFTEHPAITLKDNRNPSLTDIHVGYPVSVGFHEENGSYYAHSVIRSDAPEVR